MRNGNKISDKAFYYLMELFDSRTEYDVIELIRHSDIYYAFARFPLNNMPLDAYKIEMKVEPEVYKKFHGHIEFMTEGISNKLEIILEKRISQIKAYPDLDKYHFINNRLEPIVTQWQMINDLQTRLIDQLKVAEDGLAFQNIGNSSRAILQQLSSIVFDPLVHKASSPSIDLSEGKFKNRLHTVIKTEFSESSQKEMREFGESIVTTAEKSIDLANKLTHDLKAERFVAETCVISVISIVSYISSIFYNKQNKQ